MNWRAGITGVRVVSVKAAAPYGRRGCVRCRPARAVRSILDDDKTVMTAVVARTVVGAWSSVSIESSAVARAHPDPTPVTFIY